MSQGSEAAEQMTKETLRIAETAAKLAGAGAKNLAVFLAAVMKDSAKMKGKTNLNRMLKAGRELRVFPIQEEYLKQFAAEAKKYGILYSVIKDKKREPPTFDILVGAEDVSKINRVFERIGYPIPEQELKKTKPSLRQEIESGMPQSGLNISRTERTIKEKRITEKER